MTQNELEMGLMFMAGGMLAGSWITLVFQRRPIARKGSAGEPTPPLVESLDRRLEQLEERATFSESLLESVAMERASASERRTY